jgi:hypothetical protein
MTNGQEGIAATQAQKISRKDAKAQRLRPCKAERFRFRSGGSSWPANISRATRKRAGHELLPPLTVLVIGGIFACVLTFASLRLCVSFFSVSSLVFRLHPIHDTAQIRRDLTKGLAITCAPRFSPYRRITNYQSPFTSHFSPSVLVGAAASLASSISLVRSSRSGVTEIHPFSIAHRSVPSSASRTGTTVNQ